MKLLERNPPHIIFADDDPGTLDVYAAYVKSFGWSADYAKTARDLINQVNENCGTAGRCYDALVCDVNFFDEHPENGPRITGVTAAKVIRETLPDLPVVFVTAYSSYLVRNVVNDIGGELFQKPVDFELLFARVAYLIRWSRLVTPPEIKDERRVEGINKTPNQRRRTDGGLRVPAILEEAISEVRQNRILVRSAGSDDEH